MTSKGRRAKETRGQYKRCRFIPCKRKAVQEGLCSLHAALRPYAAEEDERAGGVAGVRGQL